MTTNTPSKMSISPNSWEFCTAGYVKSGITQKNAKIPTQQHSLAKAESSRVEPEKELTSAAATPPTMERVLAAIRRVTRVWKYWAELTYVAGIRKEGPIMTETLKLLGFCKTRTNPANEILPSRPMIGMIC
jgi:hypothetical protein